MRWTIRAHGRDRSEVIRACRWFLNRSGMKGRKRRVTIRVVPWSRIRCYGTAEQVSSREYECFLASEKREVMISTLLHEMVHVEQWERGTWQGGGEREALRREKELMLQYAGKHK